MIKCKWLIMKWAQQDPAKKSKHAEQDLFDMIFLVHLHIINIQVFQHISIPF